jgi:hypothetical protein
MSPLVPPEPVLQRFIHDVLHASVRRRVHLDPSLQKIFHTDVGVVGFELREDMLDNGRRQERLGLVVAHNLKRAPLGLRRCLQRHEPIRPHQGQRLVSPP